ncbi:MAG: ketopantoate reductase family protein [Thermoproteota archaeon]
MGELKAVAVVGCGAIGSILSLALARSGVRTYVVSRGARSCRKATVSVKGLGSSLLTVCGWDSADTLSPDVVILATKAYDVEEASSQVVQVGWRPKLVVSAQNGLGPLEALERLFGPQNSAALVLNVGGYTVGMCAAVHYGGRSAVLGSRSAGCSAIMEELASALSSVLNVECVSDVEPYRWLKLAANAAINPVGVFAWSRNKVVLSDPDARELASTLAEEVGRVAHHLGIQLPADPVDYTFEVARQTAENCNSMVQDISRGKPTEVEYINGAVWRLSLQTPFNASTNLAVYRTVRLVEKWLRGRRSPCAT